MKSTHKIISNTILCILLTVVCTTTKAQTAIVCGGNSTFSYGEGGISCSIGQIGFLYAESTKGSIQEGIQQTEILPTILQINENETIQFAVSPNPTKDFCTISLSSGNTFPYKIVNTNGKTIANGFLQNGTTIAFTNYINGIYFLHITIDERKSVTYRIIKE